MMKAISMSPRSGPRTASSDTVVLLHGHPLERNLARAVTAEAADTFVLVLAITSAAVAAALSRPVVGTPYGSLAVPVAGGLALAIGVASIGHISGAHLNPAVTFGLASIDASHGPTLLATSSPSSPARTPRPRPPGACTGIRPDRWPTWSPRPRPPGFSLGGSSRPSRCHLRAGPGGRGGGHRQPGSARHRRHGHRRGPRGRHRDQRTGQRRGRQPGPGDRADDPRGPVLRLVGIARGAASRRRDSRRPLRQVPACRQHTCLAITPADDDLSQTAERRDDHYPRPRLAAAGRMQSCRP